LTGVSELTSEQPTVTKTGTIRTITNSFEILDDDDTQSANEAAARRITPETSDFFEEPEAIVPQFHELVFEEWGGWREPDDVEFADQFLDDFQITLEMICNCR